MICNCVRSIPAVAGVTDVVKPERRRLVTVVVGAERCDALRSTLAPVIAGDAFDQSWVGVTAKDVCNRHLLAGSEELERSEEHTSELQSRQYLVCRLLLEKTNTSQ